MHLLDIRKPRSSPGGNRNQEAGAQPGVFVWLLLSLAIAAADQAAKRLMLATFEFGATVAITPFFNLVLGLNEGAAFGLLSDAGGWQRSVLLGVALGASVLLAYLIYRPDSERLARLSYSLILGGAIGNVVDRVLLGAVVDLLDFHLGDRHWPAFNLADAAITGGCALLAVSLLLGWTKNESGKGPG